MHLKAAQLHLLARSVSHERIKNPECSQCLIPLPLDCVSWRPNFRSGTRARQKTAALEAIAQMRQRGNGGAGKASVPFVKLDNSHRIDRPAQNCIALPDSQLRSAEN